MSTFDIQSFYDAVAEVLRRYSRDDLDIAKVTNIETDTVFEGYCETCSYERTVLDVLVPGLQRSPPQHPL